LFKTNRLPIIEPLVSIIIPTYNRAHLISETLDSILIQTHTNWECIVVDDGSTDNTDEVLAVYVNKDTRFKYYHRPTTRPKGANACRNYGFEKSKGEFVNWFDSDDIMLEDFIKIKLNKFNAKVDFVLCSVLYCDEKLNITKEVPFKNNINLFRDLVSQKLMLTPTILFRKSRLNKKILYNEKISRGQEMEFLSRLLFDVNNENFKIVNEPLFLYRQHSDTVSSRDEDYIKTYQQSFAFIYVGNLKRSIILNNRPLVQYHYHLLLDLLSEAIKQKHLNNLCYINYSLFKVLYKKNIVLALKLICIYPSLFLLGRNSYMIQQYFKKINWDF